MKIDINKKYRYRNGVPARALCIDAPTADPVISMTPSGEIVTHRCDGRFYEINEDECDLVEVREPREWTLSIHSDGIRVAQYCTQGGNPKGCEVIRVREIID